MRSYQSYLNLHGSEHFVSERPFERNSSESSASNLAMRSPSFEGENVSRECWQDTKSSKFCSKGRS
ncbi:hypothetical protein ACCS64_38415, partial [Rhizobium ruizarguesonis]